MEGGNSDAGRGRRMVLLAAAVSGFSIFVNSLGVKGIDSSVFTFSKNAVVAILLLAIVLGTGHLQELRTLRLRQWRQLLVLGLVGGSVPFLLFFRGLQLTTGQTSAFIHKTIFIYVTVFALLFLKERLTKRLAFGALLLIMGNYLLLRPSLSFSTGHLLILAATMLWAAENAYAKHVLKGMSGNCVAFGRMFFGSALLLAFLTVTGKAKLVWSLSGEAYAWTFLTSALLLAYVMSYYNALKHIRVTTAACILTLGAPLTTLFAWMFRGAAPSPLELAGMVCIAAGATVVAWMPGVIAKQLAQLGVRVHGRH